MLAAGVYRWCCEAFIWHYHHDGPALSGVSIADQEATTSQPPAAAKEEGLKEGKDGKQAGQACVFVARLASGSHHEAP